MAVLINETFVSRILLHLCEKILTKISLRSCLTKVDTDIKDSITFLSQVFSPVYVMGRPRDIANIIYYKDNITLTILQKL